MNTPASSLSRITGLPPPRTRGASRRSTARWATTRKRSSNPCTLRQPLRRPIDSSPFSIVPLRRPIAVPHFRDFIPITRLRVDYGLRDGEHRPVVGLEELLLVAERDAAHVAVEVELGVGNHGRRVGQTNRLFHPDRA